MIDLAEDNTSQQLSTKQLVALRAVDKVVEMIETEKPHLIDKIITLYRNNVNQLIIARALIPDECKKGVSVARRAIGVIIDKNLDEEEKRNLAKLHISANAREVGVTTKRNGTGIYAMTKKDRSELGKSNYPKGLGLLSKEELGKWGREHGAEAMSNMLEKTGKKRISDGERLRIAELSQDPDFCWKKGSWKGKPNYKKIQEKLEIEFKIRRKIRALTSEVYRIRQNT